MPSPFHIHPIVVGAFSVNCYVVANNDNRGLIIDPGDDASRIADVIRKLKIEVTAYLITHGHIDHISALAELTELFPAPVGIHPKDAKWAFGPSNAMPPYYDAPQALGVPTHELADGQIWNQLGMECHVVATPGHSPGGVCFHFPETRMLFTGDTLFAGSVGRTDLSGGNEAVLCQSLARLIALPGDTVIYPGHGPKSTLAQEKKTNPFLNSFR